MGLRLLQYFLTVVREENISRAAEVLHVTQPTLSRQMKELGLVMKISELGVTDDMIEGIADGTIILDGGYKVLDRDEVVKVLKASM